MSIRLITRGIVITFCVCWLSVYVILPAGGAALYSFSYMEQVVHCDTAMESAWYGPIDAAETKAETIHLLDCHDYDKTRKTMLMLGLPETYLSWLGLQALEIYQRPAAELAEPHKFRER